MKRKLICLALSFVLIFSLTACWNARELNTVGISLAMGLDIEGDKILVTFEIVNPSYTQKNHGGGDVGPVKYVQGIGNTIFEAFRDVSLKFDRRILISHNKLIILGEDFARRGLINQTDQLFRNRELRETAYMLIAKGAKAYEVMGINNGLEDLPGNYILNLIRNKRDNPKTVDVRIMNYLRDYYLEGIHTVAGVVEMIDRTQIDETGKDMGTKDKELTVIGAAVFKDDILVAYISGNDTKALNYIKNNVKKGLITFPTPKDIVRNRKSNLKDKHLSSVLTIKVKTKNDVEIKDEGISLKSKVKIRGTIGEVIGDIDVYNEEEFKLLEEACSNTVKEAIKHTVEKVQREIGLDIFGFGLIFQRKYPDEFKKIKDNWDEIFSHADYQIEVETNLIRTGLIDTPINVD